MLRMMILFAGLVLAGCATPSNLLMPAFGPDFDVAGHGAATPDMARIIIYRSPDIDETIKYEMVVAHRLMAGFSFDGAFLALTQEPGKLKVMAYQTRWKEDFPVGELLSGKIQRAPLPTSYPHQQQRTIKAETEFDATAGSVTYLKLKRSVTKKVVICKERRTTITICRDSTDKSILESVPWQEAHLDLAGIRETLYEGRQ